METIKLHEEVWELRDFLTEEETEFILGLVSSVSEDFWYKDVTAVGHWVGRSTLIEYFDNKVFKNIAINLDRRLDSVFVNHTQIHQVNHVLRATAGQGMDVHRDDVELPDKVNQFGVVIYLNDDYEGGEIYYPTIDFSHKPVARSMVVHRAWLPHGVKEVSGNGVRYTMTSFVKGDETTKLRED